MKLPLKYTETMKALLGAEYDAYLASFDVRNGILL